VLGVRNVATRHSRAGLVCGRSHPVGSVASLAIASTRTRNLGVVGLRRAARRVGDIGWYSFRTGRRIALWQIAVWIAVIVIAGHYLGRWVAPSINAAVPTSVLGAYPQLSGWLYLVDVVFGLALVAYSEEIIFRRCARHLFQAYIGDGYLLVLATSLLFGAYHWWAGVGNIVGAAMLGVLLMLFLQRSQALWPVVLGHYLIDVVSFA